MRTYTPRACLHTRRWPPRCRAASLLRCQTLMPDGTYRGRGIPTVAVRIKPPGDCMDRVACAVTRRVRNYTFCPYLTLRLPLPASSFAGLAPAAYCTSHCVHRLPTLTALTRTFHSCWVENTTPTWLRDGLVYRDCGSMFISSLSTPTRGHTAATAAHATLRLRTYCFAVPFRLTHGRDSAYALRFTAPYRIYLNSTDMVRPIPAYNVSTARPHCGND